MNWFKALEEARSIEEVVDVANEFISQKPDDFWSSIPSACRPGLIASEDELHQWHHLLVQEISRVRTANLRLQDLTVFLLRASVRAHQISLKREDGRPSNDREFHARGRSRA